MSLPLHTDSWYPTQYWVPQAEAKDRPLRYGDLMTAPEMDQNGIPLLHKFLDSKTGEAVELPWFAAFILSPSCELGDKAKPDTPVLIAMVSKLTDSVRSEAAKIVTGWSHKPEGNVVAYAKFAYLAPVSFSSGHDEIMYGDYSRTATIKYKDLTKLKRVAALDHDARVCLIRREIYYKYRWLLSLEEVQKIEAERISKDSNFIGPKPDWANSQKEKPD